MVAAAAEHGLDEDALHAELAEAGLTADDFAGQIAEAGLEPAAVFTRVQETAVPLSEVLTLQIDSTLPLADFFALMDDFIGQSDLGADAFVAQMAAALAEVEAAAEVEEVRADEEPVDAGTGTDVVTADEDAEPIDADGDAGGGASREGIKAGTDPPAVEDDPAPSDSAAAETAAATDAASATETATAPEAALTVPSQLPWYDPTSQFNASPFSRPLFSPLFSPLGATLGATLGVNAVAAAELGNPSCNRDLGGSFEQDANAVVLGGFEIDGNYCQNTDDALDWGSSSVHVAEIHDGYGNKGEGPGAPTPLKVDTTQFSNSQKEDAGVWTDYGRSNQTGKPDIGRVMTYVPEDGDIRLLMAFERNTGNGSITIYVELNQSGNHASEGRPTPNPDRKKGDLRVTFVQSGNAVPTLDAVHLWDGARWVNHAVMSDNAEVIEGRANAGSAVNSSTGVTLAANTFVEMAVNFTAMMEDTGECLPSFSVINIRTTSSNTALADWIGPGNVDIPSTCSARLTVNKEIQDYDAEGDPISPRNPGAEWTFEVVSLDGRVHIEGESRKSTDDDGTVIFPMLVDGGGAQAGALSITEPALAGWGIRPDEQTGQNAVCWADSRLEGPDRYLPVINGPTTPLAEVGFETGWAPQSQQVGEPNSLVINAPHRWYMTGGIFARTEDTADRSNHILRMDGRQSGGALYSADGLFEPGDTAWVAMRARIPAGSSAATVGFTVTGPGSTTEVGHQPLTPGDDWVWLLGSAVFGDDAAQHRVETYTSTSTIVEIDDIFVLRSLDPSVVGADADDERVAPGMTVLGIRSLDEVTCTVVNHLTGVVGITNGWVFNDYDWWVHKTATPAAQHAAPGVGATFDYEVTVGATADTPLVGATALIRNMLPEPVHAAPGACPGDAEWGALTTAQQEARQHELDTNPDAAAQCGYLNLQGMEVFAWPGDGVPTYPARTAWAGEPIAWEDLSTHPGKAAAALEALRGLVGEGAITAVDVKTQPYGVPGVTEAAGALVPQPLIAPGERGRWDVVFPMKNPYTMPPFGGACASDACFTVLAYRGPLAGEQHPSFSPQVLSAAVLENDFRAGVSDTMVDDFGEAVTADQCAWDEEPGSGNDGCTFAYSATLGAELAEGAKGTYPNTAKVDPLDWDQPWDSSQRACVTDPATLRGADGEPCWHEDRWWGPDDAGDGNVWADPSIGPRAQDDDKRESTAVVTVTTGASLTVEHTAQVSLSRNLNWEVTKEANPASATADPAAHPFRATAEYTITATPVAATDVLRSVEGVITVTNPNTHARNDDGAPAEGTGVPIQVRELPDFGADPTVCTVSSPEGNTLTPEDWVTVPAASAGGPGKLELSYRCDFSGMAVEVTPDDPWWTDGSNTVEISWDKQDAYSGLGLGDGDPLTIPAMSILDAKRFTQEPYGLGVAKPGDGEEGLCPFVAESLAWLVNDGIWAPTINTGTPWTQGTGCYTGATQWNAGTPDQALTADVDPADLLLDADGRVRVGIKFDQPGLGYINPRHIVPGETLDEDVYCQAHPDGGSNDKVCYEGIAVDQDGRPLSEPTGFDVEVARDVVARTFGKDTEIVWVHTPSATRQHALGACDPGETGCDEGDWSQVVDLVAGTYTMNADRLGSVDFAGPYFQAGQALLIRTDDAGEFTVDPTTKEWEPGDETVCSAIGSTPLARLRDMGADVVGMDTYGECLQALVRGDVDAVSTDDIILLGYAAQTSRVCPIDDVVTHDGENPAALSATVEDCYPQAEWDLLPDRAVAPLVFDGENGYGTFTKDDVRGEFVDVWDTFVQPQAGDPAYLGTADWYEGDAPRGGTTPGEPTKFGPFSVNLDGPFYGDDPLTYVNRATVFDRGEDCAVPDEPGDVDPCTASDGDPVAEDDAEVTITAPDSPMVSDHKAKATFGSEYTWEISKTVIDETEVYATPGAKTPVTYRITAQVTETRSDVTVAGSFTLEPPQLGPEGGIWALEGLAVVVTDDDGDEYPATLGACGSSLDSDCSETVPAALNSSTVGGNVPLTIRYSTGAAVPAGSGPWTARITMGADETPQDERFILPTANWVPELRQVDAATRETAVNRTATVTDVEFAEAFLDTWDPPAATVLGVDSEDDGKVVLDAAAAIDATVAIDATPNGPLTHKWVLEYEATLAAPAYDGGTRTYANTAVITPDSCESGATDCPAQDEDTETVTVRSGYPLGVRAVVEGEFSAEFGWDIDKRVVDVDGTDVTIKDGDASVEAGSDRKATATYEIEATPKGYENPKPTLSGTLELTNPNPWPVPATSFDLKFHQAHGPEESTPFTCTVSASTVTVAALAGAVDAFGAQVRPTQTVPFTCTIPPEAQEYGLPLGWLEATVSWDAAANHTISDTSSNQRTQHESNFELEMLDAERFTTEPYGVGVAKGSQLCVPLAGALAGIVGDDDDPGTAWSDMLLRNTGTDVHTFPFARSTGCYTTKDSWTAQEPASGDDGGSAPSAHLIGDDGKVRVGIKFDQPGLGYADPGDIVDAGVCHGGDKSDSCYQTLKPGAEPRGFGVDIARALVADVFGQGTEIVWVHTPSATRQHALGACDPGEAGCNGDTWSQVVDMVAATYTMNENRLGSVDFVGPYYQAGQGLLVRTDDLRDGAFTVADNAWKPAGERICSATGSTPLAHLKAMEADGVDLKVVERNTYSACIGALRAGQVDAVSTDDVILLGYAEAERTHDCANVIDDPDSPVVKACEGTTGARPAIWETIGDLNTIPKTEVLGIDRFTEEPYGVGTAKGSPLCHAIAGALTGNTIGVGTVTGWWADQLESLGLEPAEFMASTGCWTGENTWPGGTPETSSGEVPSTLVGDADTVRVGIKFDQPGLGYADPADIVEAGVCHDGANTGSCYQTLREDAEPSGFEVKLAEAIVAEVFPAGTEIEWVHTPSATRQHALGACDPGETGCDDKTWSQVVDFVIGTYTMNASRLESVDFAGPYFQAGQGLLVRTADADADKFAISDEDRPLKDGEKVPTGVWSPDGGSFGDTVPKGTWVPNGERICSAHGSTPHQTLLKMKSEGVKVEPVARATYSACMRALWNGWVDAVSTDDIILAGLAEDALVSAEGTPGYYMKVDDKIDDKPVSDYGATDALQCTNVGQDGDTTTCATWEDIETDNGANPFDELICTWNDTGSPCLFRYKITHDTPWPAAGPEEWTNTARLIGNDPGVCTDLENCTEDPFTVVNPELKDDATVRITATPPKVTVDASARTQRDYDWQIDKTAVPGSVQVGADGTIDVTYTLRIDATLDDTAKVWVGGTVELTNEEAFDVELGDEFQVLIGNESTTVEAGTLPAAAGEPGAAVPGTVALRFGTWLTPADWATLADGNGDVPVVVTLGSHELLRRTLDIDLEHIEINATAIVTDEPFHDELVAAIEKVDQTGSSVATIDAEDNVTVKATDCLADGGCTLTYTVTFGPEDEGVVHNVATLTPTPPDTPGICPVPDEYPKGEDAEGNDVGFCVDPEDSQDPEHLTADEDVVVQVGTPLIIDHAVAASVIRTYDWSVAKQVWCAPTDGCALRDGTAPVEGAEPGEGSWPGSDDWWTDQPVNRKAGLDGTADYKFRVTVTAEDAAWSGWSLGGEVIVSNPNPWAIPITPGALEASYSGVTCGWVDDADVEVSAADVEESTNGLVTLTYTCAPVEKGADLIPDPEDFAGSITAGLTWDYRYTKKYTGDKTGSATDTVILDWADSGAIGWQVEEINRYRDVFDAMVNHQLTDTLDWRETTKPVTREYTVTLRADETDKDTANVAWLADPAPSCEPGDVECPEPCEPGEPECPAPCDPKTGDGCEEPPTPPQCTEGDEECSTIPVDVVDPEPVTHTVSAEVAYAIDYTWAVEKKAFHAGTEVSDPVQVLPGNTATIDYQIVATATRSSTTPVRVGGQVCLAGDPDVDILLPQTWIDDRWTPTISGWVLANTIQYDTFDLTDFDFSGLPTITDEQSPDDFGKYYLPAGTGHHGKDPVCLGYDTDLDPAAAERDITVNVRLGDAETGGLSSSDTITRNKAENVTNESATLTDTFDEFCASLPGEHGVECADNGAATLVLEKSSTWPYWPAAREWTFDYEAKLGYVDGGPTVHTNTATLDPLDAQPVTNDAEVTIETVDSFTLGVKDAVTDASVKHTANWSVVKETCSTGTDCATGAEPGEGGWTTETVTRKPGLDGSAEFQYRVIVTAEQDTWTDWHLGGEFTVTNRNEWEVPVDVNVTYPGVVCSAEPAPGSALTVPAATDDGAGEAVFTFSCELGEAPLAGWSLDGGVEITIDPADDAVLGGVDDATVQTSTVTWVVAEENKTIDVYDHLTNTVKLNPEPVQWTAVGEKHVFVYTDVLEVTESAVNTAWLVSPVDPPCVGEGCTLPEPPQCKAQDATCATTEVEVTKPDAVTAAVSGAATYTAGYDWDITKTASYGGEDVADGGTVEILPTPPATAEITYQVDVTATRQPGTLAVDGAVCLTSDPDVDTWLPDLSGEVVVGAADGAEVQFAYGADGLAAGGLAEKDGKYYLTAGTKDLCIPYSWSQAEDQPGALEGAEPSATVTVGGEPVVVNPLTVTSAVTDASAMLTDSFKEQVCTGDGETDFPCLPAVLLPGDMTGGADGTATKSFTYTAHLGSGTHTNIATLDPGEPGNPVEDEHTVTVSDTQEQPLTVTHEPTATITRTHAWELVKEVFNPKAGESGAWVAEDGLVFVTDPGGKAEVRYRLAVTRTAEVWTGGRVTGTATVSNPNRWPVEAQVSVSTSTFDGWTCTIDGTDAQSAPVAVVAAEGENPGTAGVDYTCLPPESLTAKPGGAVTASVTWESADESGTSDSVGSQQPLTWTVNEVNGSVTVWDDGAGTLDSPWQVGVVGWEQTTLGEPRTAGDYTLTLTDPDAGGDPVAYTNVAWLGTDPDNPGHCVEDDDCIRDEREVEVTQPDPDAPVDLVAEGRVQVDYDWTITKDVDQPTVHLAPDETRDVTYTITLNSVANRGRVWVEGELALDGPTDTTGLVVTLDDVPVMHQVGAAEPDGSVTVRYWTWLDTAPVDPLRLEVYAGHGTAEQVLLRRGNVDVTVMTTYTDEQVTVSDEMFPAGYDPGVRYAQDCLPGQRNAAQCQFTYQVTLGGAPGSQSTTTNVAVLHVQPSEPDPGDPGDPVIPVCEPAPDGAAAPDPEGFCLEPDDDDAGKDEVDVDVTVDHRPDLSITKAMDSEMTFQRLYTWQIEKVADGPDRKEMGDDGTAAFDYLVTLTAGTPVDSHWRLTGRITVTNPNPLPVHGVQIAEHPDAAGVTCTLDPATMPVGASAEAGFTIPAATVGVDGEPVPGEITVGVLCDAAGPVLATAANAATVTWDSQELGTAHDSATVRVEFGELALRPTSFVDDAIQVFDQFYDGATADPNARRGEPVLLGTASRGVDGELVCEPAPEVRLGTTDGTCQFGYSSEPLAGPAHAGTVTEYYNEAWIGQTGQKDGQVVTVTDQPGPAAPATPPTTQTSPPTAPPTDPVTPPAALGTPPAAPTTSLTALPRTGVAVASMLLLSVLLIASGNALRHRGARHARARNQGRGRPL